MNRIILLLIVLGSSEEILAQTSYKVRGKVIDEKGVEVPFANVAIYRNDSSMVTGVASDAAGLFNLPAAPGKYYVRVTFLSYEETIVPDVIVAGEDVDLGEITLRSTAEVLDAVVVEGERSQMQLQLDKRVFEVGKDLSNISSSASDILDNVPSVTVDVDGNVSLRGSQNVRVLIDGRPSGLTGISVADALRQLQGNLIEKVEVITNPSSRYDAEGEVGIINIVLKKEKNKGVNGSFSANAGYPENYGASFNLNFRRKKLNFFTSYGINHRSVPGYGKSFQSFNSGDSTFSYSQVNDRNRSGLSHNIRAGLDYFLTEKSSLSGSFIIRKSDGINTTFNTYTDFDALGNDVRTVSRNEREEEPELNSEIALAYRKQYDREGQLLTADLKWIDNQEVENATFEQTDFSIDSTGFQRSRNTENERNGLAQIDYIQPFGKNGKIETGLKSTYRQIDNDFSVEQLDQESNSWTVLPQLLNRLIYTEKIHAAYFMIANQGKKFSWQTGVRGELTDISVELAQTDEKNYQNYFNVFPSAHVSYALNPRETFQLSYSYRLSRPRFRDLMPFSNYSDNRSIRVGNPNLKPEFTHSLEAGYLLNVGSASILSSAYYRYRTQVVENIATVDSAGFTRMTPVNLATQNAYGLEFNVSWTPFDWWRINGNANFYRAITSGVYQEQELNADAITMTSRATSRIKFFKKWDFQTGFNYRAPRNTTQGRDLSVYYFDLGLSRDVFKGNGTFTFSVRDVLNSRKYRSIIERPDEGYTRESEFQWRSRQFMLTFTYRLNSRKSNNERESDGDEDME